MTLRKDTCIPKNNGVNRAELKYSQQLWNDKVAIPLTIAITNR